MGKGSGSDIEYDRVVMSIVIIVSHSSIVTVLHTQHARTFNCCDTSATASVSPLYPPNVRGPSQLDRLSLLLVFVIKRYNQIKRTNIVNPYIRPLCHQYRCR